MQSQQQQQQQQQFAFNPQQGFQQPQQFQSYSHNNNYNPSYMMGVHRSQATSENMQAGGYNTWDQYRNSSFLAPPLPPFTRPAPLPPKTVIFDFENPDNSYPADWKSIYIPRIDFRYTRLELIKLIENSLNMGTVSRIDFAPTKDGSGRMAFIHMTEFNEESQTRAIREAMETTGGWDLPAEHNIYPIIRLRFVINRRPIPTTEFTMETLADAVNRTIYTQEQYAQDMERRDKDAERSYGLMDQWRAAAFMQIQELRDIGMHAHESCKRLHEELETEKRKSAEQESRIDRLERLVNKKVGELNASKSRFNETYSTMESLYEKIRRLETEVRDVVYKLDSNYI